MYLSLIIPSYNYTFLRPAAPVRVARLLPIVPAAVRLCLQQRHWSKVEPFWHCLCQWVIQFFHLEQGFNIVFFTLKMFNSSVCRCWTAGWGKDEFSGSFQFIQHKVASTWEIRHWFVKKTGIVLNLTKPLNRWTCQLCPPPSATQLWSRLSTRRNLVLGIGSSSHRER